MAIIVAKPFTEESMFGQIAQLNTLAVHIHLFKSDTVLGIEMVIEDFDLADFGGYDGPHTIASWSAGGFGWAGVRYVVGAPDETWEADGTSVNVLYGYLVTNEDDEIVFWAERRPAGPVTIGSVAGQQYIVGPRYARRSEFLLTPVEP